jgi:hypothetical protein
MKRMFVLICLLLSCTVIFAQARTTTAEYQKSMQPALEIEVPYAEKTVSRSLIESMENKGYKSKESKGFITFKSVKLPELGVQEYDLYFKVDRKSRKDKETSILTMLIASGLEKFISESDNPELFENAKKMLSEQTSITAALDLELQIKEQKEILKKEDKKLASLVSDSVSLQKKKVRLEEEIVENAGKRQSQKAAIEKQRQIFEKLAARRKQ